MTEIGQALAAALGADRVAEDAATLAAHRTDYWVLAHLRAAQGRLEGGPACVVRPRTTAEVATAVRLAAARGVPIVARGGGSGVVGGATPPAGSLVVDLGALTGIVELNEVALHARVRAGTNGGEYERLVQARGYTTGNYPQSIDRSTVGGWVATRAAGQWSTRYGNIEDLCLGVEAVLASGAVVRTNPAPRASTGPSLRELFLGSEGTLGIVTEVTLRLHPLPEHRALATLAFASMAAGLEAIRRVVRVGWRPAVLRLYDAVETGRHFGQWVPPDRAALVVVGEGPRALVEVELAAVRAAAAAEGAVECDAAAAAHWLAGRNTVPPWDFFLARELIVDTIEVAAGWDRVAGLYDAVLATLGAVPGIVVASAHSSHSYPQGTNLYVTFVVKPADWARAEESYLDAWGRVMQATLAAGGTISHHHGIGRLRTPWLAEELGSSYPVLAAVKRALDPANVMNPGVLVPAR
ncbi:MAG TPA: FAD-binding oxidoreductase [Candidatus Binatia bacterium]|nr:FAD-binding oxidoreductase [Candidatus Binatia bacterium]